MYGAMKATVGTCYEGLESEEKRKFYGDGLKKCNFQNLCLPVSLPLKVENIPHCHYFYDKLNWVCAMHILDDLKETQEWNCELRQTLYCHGIQAA